MNPVFDFGGVLFRWQQHEFMARLLPAHAPDAPSAHALVVSFFQGFGRAWLGCRLSLTRALDFSDSRAPVD